MDPEIFIPIAGMLTGGVMVVAVARTVRFWIERHYEHKRAMMAGSEPVDLLGVEERVAALEADMSARMFDVEERLDFTERVLAAGRGRQTLEGEER